MVRNTKCIWPSRKWGETFNSFEDAKNRCNNIPRCTMFYKVSSYTFRTCPDGSTIETRNGFTLYTRGKL